MNEQTRKNGLVAGRERMELSETPVIDGEQAGAPATGPGELSEGERARVVTTMGRLVDEAKRRFDDCKNNMEDGRSGGYGDDLTEAIELLAELKKGVRRHDEDTLKAAFRAGFEHAKKIILAEIQKQF